MHKYFVLLTIYIILGNNEFIMKVNKKVFFGLIFGLLFFISENSVKLFSQKSANPDTPSYYVRANGSDTNAGTSEKAPFRTLTKAIEEASKTPIKKITVIGKLEENVTTAGATPSRLIERDWNEPHPNQILITGKQNANKSDRAVLTAKTGTALLVTNLLFIRMENIEISGCIGGGISLLRGDLTLANGVKVINNKGDNGAGIFIDYGTLILCDNAEVSNNTAVDFGGGIFLNECSLGILAGNAKVSNNKANNGGGIMMSDATLEMIQNSTVSNNIAKDFGGGIFTQSGDEVEIMSIVRIADNAAILRNRANNGGGILLQGLLHLFNNAKISENIARTECGGVYGAAGIIVKNSKDNIRQIINNQAPKFPDTNFGSDY